MTGETTTVISAALGCGLVVLAVLLGIPAPAGSAAARVKGLGDQPADEPMVTRRIRWRGFGFVLASGGVVIVLALTVGARSGVFASTTLVVFGTTALLLARHRTRRRSWEQRSAVAQACSVLAAQVRIGQVPVEALRSAAQDCPVIERSVATADLGGDVVGCWKRQATEPGASGLADLARGWQLSASTGAELATVLEQVAETLESDQALNLVIASEAAAPRATGKVMAVLPLVGISLGYLMGGDPVDFLVSSPIGWACLLIGAVSACLGVVWMERIADHASAVGG